MKRYSLTTPLVALVVMVLSGCQSAPIQLSNQTRNVDLYNGEPTIEVPQLLSRLQVGMCEDEVFKILNITHKTPNLLTLNVRDVYDHVSLLNGRVHMDTDCTSVHTAEVPYVGHRIPFTNIRNSAYLKQGYKWVRRSTGEDWYVDLLFLNGAFISFAKGGEENKDSRNVSYPWESIFGDPFSKVRMGVP